MSVVIAPTEHQNNCRMMLGGHQNSRRNVIFALVGNSKVVIKYEGLVESDGFSRLGYRSHI